MNIARSSIIEVAQTMMGQALNKMGYFLDELPAGGIGNLKEGFWDFSFQKKPAPPSEFYHTISIVPTGFSQEDLFDMDTVLYRSTYQLSSRPSSRGKTLFRGPLGMYFLDKIDSRVRPHPWHFLTIEELRSEFSDILDRLLRYGIPLLENPNCGWDEWIGKKPIRHIDGGYIIFDPSGRNSTN